MLTYQSLITMDAKVIQLAGYKILSSCYLRVVLFFSLAINLSNYSSSQEDLWFQIAIVFRKESVDLMHGLSGVLYPLLTFRNFNTS